MPRTTRGGGKRGLDAPASSSAPSARNKRHTSKSLGDDGSGGGVGSANPTDQDLAEECQLSLEVGSAFFDNDYNRGVAKIKNSFSECGIAHGYLGRDSNACFTPKESLQMFGSTRDTDDYKYIRRGMFYCKYENCPFIFPFHWSFADKNFYARSAHGGKKHHLSHDHGDKITSRRQSKRNKGEQIVFSQPVCFQAKWSLDSRQRRTGLVIIDMQVEYKKIVSKNDGKIVKNVQRLVEVYRKENNPIYWSSFVRYANDNISNAYDRFHGDDGKPGRRKAGNGFYLLDRQGAKLVREIKPKGKQEQKNHIISEQYDLFQTVDGKNQSILHEKLKRDRVDTVVLVGLWTDECILATAFGAFARNYDVVVVEDAVGTATDLHDSSIKILQNTLALILTHKDVVQYMNRQNNK